LITLAHFVFFVVGLLAWSTAPDHPAPHLVVVSTAHFVAQEFVLDTTPPRFTPHDEGIGVFLR